METIKSLASVDFHGRLGGRSVCACVRVLWDTGEHGKLMCPQRSQGTVA